MRGTIVHRGNSYSVVVELDRDPVTGKRRQKWHSGYRTKREAEAARVEILARQQRGEYVVPNQLTVRGFLEGEWLPAVRASLRPSTYESYELNVERIASRIGSARLQSLTPAALNKLYGELAKTLSARTVRYVHTVLRRALADAVKWNRLVRNPADAAEPPSASAAKARAMQTWTAAELRSFLEQISEDRLFAAWRLAATTGMRRGEVLGLGWSAVDLDAGRVAITRALIEGRREPRFSEAKTDRGRRSVALDPDTVAALRAHRKAQAAERLAWGPAWQGHGLVFCREDGTPIWPRSFSRSFAAHAEAAELPVIRLHDLRHTHASLALAAGVHPKVISERLGHSTVSITLDTYSHAIPALQEDAAAKVASLLK